MENSLVMQASLAVPTIRPFLSSSQLMFMAHAARGEEGEFFLQKIIGLAQRIDAMPVTYGQDGMGDEAVVYLHYFCGGSDWYITEKDVDGGVCQAFGYAVINGDDEMAECGYISIEELASHGVELDLHFSPRTLAAVKMERAKRSARALDAVKPWVVVMNPGADDH